MFIPKSHIITLELAKKSEIGAKLVTANLTSPKHSLLSAFLLQEGKNPDSDWRPYLNLLPKHFNSFPVFYDSETKAWLQGSPFLLLLQQKVLEIEFDYDSICKIAPEFEYFHICAFFHMRMAVSSRVFGMNIDGVQTEGCVPLADMLNHKRPIQSSWIYDQDREGFTLEAMEEIHSGNEVLESYGKKSNYDFLLNYGFVSLENDAEEYQLKLFLRENDPYLEEKRRIIAGQEPFTIHIKAKYHDKSTQELLGYMRFLVLDDFCSLERLIENCGNVFKATLTPPKSAENELKALELLRHLLEVCLQAYPTTLEQDNSILDTELTENQRNCVIIRKADKVILGWFLQMVETCLPYLQRIKVLRKKDFIGSPYHDYLAQVISPLLKA